MAFAHDMPSDSAGTSLYAAIMLARLVQKAKDCLKSRIKKCITSTKPPQTTHPIKLTTYACKTLSSTISSRSTSSHYVGRRRNILRAQRKKADVPSLLAALDLQISCQDLPLRTVAAQDSLFLKHEFHVAWTPKSLDRIYDVLDSTTELLGRLQDFSGSDGLPHVDDDVRCGDFQCAKFIANLKHLLYCLEQIALDAIIHHYLDLVAAHILHWHNYWQQQKRLREGWFAEWPNGQRPLSTTWPWNVKPSLMVLWGVCWMFYGPAGHHHEDRDNVYATRNRRGIAQGASELGGDLRTRQQGLESQQAQTGQDPSDVWASSTPNTYPNYSWLHPQQAGVPPRRASNPRESHEITGPAMTNFLLQAILGTTLPTYNANVNANPYITSTSTDSSDLFATSAIQWPYSQGINQDSPSAYAPNYAPWPATYSTTENITGILTATPQGIGPQPPVRSYAPRRQANPNPQAAIGGSLGSFGFGLGLPLQDMQDYPSPHSAVSDQTTSSCLSLLPGAMISPRIPVVTSPSISMVPSVGGSSNSRQSSRRSTEPPRNAQGILYCADLQCAKQPPVFSRKCEWTKHMDKHTRPYVCDEPECDNIRGFTYSGGLLRHQREVHRQHGGPKVSCMCPHKDCKRSTGVGFSRKENLNEHLRRCHQPEHQETGSPPGNAEDLSSRSRKRRRAADTDGGGQEQREEDDGLREEVKRLRKEVAEKEERIKNLEKWMENLTRGQGGLR